MPDKNQSITDVISNIGDLIKSGKGDKKAAKRFRERNTVTTPSKGFSLSDPLQGIDVKGELETAKPGVEKAFLKDKGDEPVKHVGDYGTVPTPSEGFSFNPTLGLPTSEPGTTDDPGDVSHGDPSNPFQGQRPEMEFLRPEFRDAGSQTSLKQKDPTTIQGAMARYDILSQGRLTNGVDPTPDRKAFEAKVRGWMDKGVWNEGHAHEVFASQFGGDFNQKLNEFGVATNTDQRVAPPRGIDRDEGAKDFSLMQVPGKLAEGVLDTTIAGYMGLDAENPEDMAKLEGLKNTDAYRLTHGLVELGSYVAMPGGMAKGIAGGGGMEGLMNLTPEKIKENPVGAATGVLGNIPQLSPLANLANKVYDPKTKTVDFGRADWVDYTLATIGLGVAAHPFVEGPIKESIAVRKTAMRLNEMFPEITPAEARTIAMSANRFGKWAEKGEFDKMREYLSDPKNAHLFDIYGKMRDRMTKMQGEQTWQNWSSGKNPGWGFNWDEKHRSPNDPAKDVGDEIKQEKYNAERENAKDAWEGTDKNPSEPSTPPALPGRQGKPPRPVEDILRELGANGEVTLGPEDKGQDLSHITKLITSGEYQVERKDDGTLRIFKAGGASPVAAQTSEPAVQPTEPTPTTEQTPTNTQPTEESSLPTQPETKPTEPSTQWPQDTPGTVRKVMGRDATSVSTFDGNDGIRYTLYQTRDGGIVHARDLGTGDTTDLRHWPDFEQAKREFGTTMRIAGDAFNPDAGNPTTGTPDTPGSSNNGPGVVDEEKKPKADVSEPKAEEPSEPAAPKEDTPEPEKKPVAPKLQQKGPDLELVPDAEPPKAGSRHFTEYSPSIIDHYHDWKPAPDYNDSLSDIQETKGGKEFNPRDYTVVEGKRKGDGKPAFGIKHPNGGFTFLGHGELDNDGDPYVSVDHIHDAIIAAQEEADAEDKKNNPAAKHPGMKFKVGDRVKFNDGQHQFSGRTGTVTKATPETIGWQKARIHIGRGGVGAEPIETDYSHYQKYSVKTDQGAEHDNVDETMIGSHDAEADSTLAPDPELDGKHITPQGLRDKIKKAKFDAEGYAKSATRARNPKTKASYKRLAEDWKAEAEKLQKIYDEWVSKHGGLSDLVGGGRETKLPSKPQEPTSPDRIELQDGLVLEPGDTAGTVRVVGNTKAYKDQLRAMGGKWSSRQTAWVFRSTAKDSIVNRFGVKVDNQPEQKTSTGNVNVPVPETGKPITANVYHATDKTFSQFDLAKSGTGLGETDHPSAWFHENPKWAEMISERFKSRQGRVMPSTVEFKNPLVVDAEDYAKRVSHTADQAFVVDGQKLYDIKWFKNIALRDAIDGGHDGLIIRNGYDLIPIKGDVYAATESSAIRPVTAPETGVKEPAAPQPKSENPLDVIAEDPKVAEALRLLKEAMDTGRLSMPAPKRLDMPTGKNSLKMPGIDDDLIDAMYDVAKALYAQGFTEPTTLAPLLKQVAGNTGAMFAYFAHPTIQAEAQKQQKPEDNKNNDTSGSEDERVLEPSGDSTSGPTETETESSRDGRSGGSGGSPAKGGRGSDSEVSTPDDPGDESDDGSGRGDEGSGSGRSGAGGSTDKPGPTEGSGSERRPAGEFRFSNVADAKPVQSKSEKLKRAVAAIEAVRSAEQNKSATAEEQLAMALFPGWGYDKAVLNPNSKAGQSANAQKLRSLLTPKERRKAFIATGTSHFTDPHVVQSIWELVQHVGFDGAGSTRNGTRQVTRILEPSAGSGLFKSLAPEKTGDWTLVDMDSTSAGVLKFLFPDSKVINKPLQDAGIGSNQFDIVGSNVPFSDQGVFDASLLEQVPGEIGKSLQSNLHNYMIAKGVLALTPGGVGYFITSRYTMDGVTEDHVNFRKWMAENTDLLGAVRLPSEAFDEQANTEVVTDLIFVRKKGDGLPAVPTHAWEKSVSFTPEHQSKSAPINEYYVANPKHVLGYQDFSGTMYGPGQYNVHGSSGEKLAGEITAILKSAMPTNAYAPVYTPSATPKVVDAPEGTKLGEVFKDKKGGLFRLDPIAGVQPFTLSKQQLAIFDDYLSLKEARDEVIRANMNGASDEDLAKAQAKLKKAYDKFKKAHGNLHSASITEKPAKDEDGNPVLDEDGDPVMDRSARFKYKNLLFKDSQAVAVFALEVWDPVKLEVTKLSDIFTKRVYNYTQEVEAIEDPHDALAASINVRGKVDIDWICSVLDATPDKVLDWLKGELFLTPDGEYESKEDYLSGNVVEKLAQAKQAVESGRTEFQPNAEALEANQPEPRDYKGIYIHMGAGWMPKEIVKEFVQDQFGWNVTVNKNGVRWSIAPNNGGNKFGPARAQQWATPDKSAGDLLEAALENRSVSVYSKDADGNNKLDEEKTTAANAAVSKIKEAFVAYCDTKPLAQERITEAYNREVNCYVPRKVDGSGLTFPGLTPMVELRKHRVDAIARALRDAFTLWWHGVGSGKTYTGAMLAMKLKKTSLRNKVMFVAYKPTLEQIIGDFYKAYPDANLLAAHQDSFSADHREEFLALAAAGDWDAVIVTQEQFNSLSLSPDAVEKFFDSEMDRVLTANGMDEGEANKAKKSKDPTVREIGRALDAMEQAKIKAVNTARGFSWDKKSETWKPSKRPPAMTFEQLGIDHVIVDEAHMYKGLPVPTKMQNLNQSTSTRAQMLQMKLEYIRSMGGGATMMTGTALVNSAAEVHVWMRYLMPNELAKRGLDTFDSFVASFGIPEGKVEMSTSGKYQVKERIRAFRNIEELATIFTQVSDIVPTEAVGEIKLPGLMNEAGEVTGKPIIVVTTPTPGQRYIMTELAEEFKRLPKRPEKGDPNHLSLSTKGRKASQDARLVDPTMGEEPGSKLEALADRMARIYKKYESDKAAQLAFVDIGVPGKDQVFDMYAELTKMLVDRGVKRSEIASISDAKNTTDRLKIAERVRKGDIRILIGSRPKLGIGMNVQDRLIAVHHLMLGWNPSQIEQGNGRIIRFGNMYYNVMVFYYMNKGTYDQVTAERTMGKGNVFTQFMKALSGKAQGFKEIEDLEDSEGAASMGEVVSAATGDERLIALITAANAEKKAEAVFNSDKRNQTTAKAKANYLLDDAIPSLTREQAVVNKWNEAMGSPDVTHTDGSKIEKPSEFWDKIADSVNALAKLGQWRRPEVVAKIGGLEIVVGVQRIDQDTGDYDAFVGVRKGEYELDYLSVVNPKTSAVWRFVRDPFTTTSSRVQVTDELSGSSLGSRVYHFGVRLERRPTELEKSIENNKEEAKNYAEQAQREVTSEPAWRLATRARRRIEFETNVKAPWLEKGDVGGFDYVRKEWKPLDVPFQNRFGDGKMLGINEEEWIWISQGGKEGYLEPDDGKPYLEAISGSGLEISQKAIEYAQSSSRAQDDAGVPKEPWMLDMPAKGNPGSGKGTSDFAKWFAGSKVVGSAGKPLIVYHGTNAQFDEFSRDFIGEGNGGNDWGSGFYFTDSLEAAKTYSDGPEGNIKEVYLSIKNPAPKDVVLKVMDEPGAEMDVDFVGERLAALGYDGVIVEHKSGEREYVVFDPSQIRPAKAQRLDAPKVPPAPPRRIDVDPIHGKGTKKLGDIVIDVKKDFPRQAEGSSAKRTLGNYIPGSRMRFIKGTTDLDTIAHELAHLIDDRFGVMAQWKNSLTTPFDTELDSEEFQSSTTDMMVPWHRRAEQFAEYLRAWLFNPNEAEQLAPTLTKHMASVIDAKTLGKLREFGDDVRRFVGANPDEQVAAGFRTTDTSKQGLIKSVSEKLRDKADELFGTETEPGEYSTSWKDVVRRYVTTDAHAPFVSATREAMNRQGIDIGRGQDLLREGLEETKNPIPYLRLLAYADQVVKAAIDHGVMDFDGNVISEPLSAVFEPLDHTSQQTFEKDRDDMYAMMYAERHLHERKKLLERAEKRADEHWQWLLDKAQSRIEDYADVVYHWLQQVKDARRDVIAQEANAKLRANERAGIPLAERQKAAKKILAEAKAKQQKSDDKVNATYPKLVQRFADKMFKKADDRADKARIKLRRAAERQSERSGLVPTGGNLVSAQGVANQLLAHLQKNPKRYARLKAGAAAMRGIGRATVEYLRQAGVLSDDAALTITTENPYWISAHREMDDNNVAYASRVGALASHTKVIRGFKGSQRMKEDPMASLLTNLHKAHVEALKNMTVANFVNLLGAQRQMYEPGKDSGDIATQLPEGAKPTERTITVFVKGEKQQWHVPDRHLYEALSTGITNPTKSNPVVAFFMTMVGLPAKVIRTLVTQTPIFAMRNVGHDTMTRLAISNQPLKARDLWAVADKSLHELYDRYGIGLSRMEDMTSEQGWRKLQKRMARELSEAGRTVVIPVASGKVKITFRGKPSLAKMLSRAFNTYEEVLMNAERSTRMSEFQSAKRHALSIGKSEKDANLYASVVARDVMTDFRKGSLLGRLFNEVIPFFNAAIQGQSSFYSNFGKNPGRNTLRVLILAAIGILLERWWSHMTGSDEDRKNRTESQRLMFHSFKVGPDHYILIPKGREVGLVSTLIDHALDQLGGGYQEFEQYLAQAWQSASPLNDAADVLGGWKVFIEMLTNHDIRFDKDIVPSYEKNKPLSERKTDRASTLAQKLGSNIDPRLIDHFIEGMGGYVGKYATGLSDLAAGKPAGAKDSAEILGLFSSTMYGNRHVQWVMKKGREAGMRDNPLKAEFDAYFSATEPGERNRLGRETIAKAEAMRKELEPLLSEGDRDAQKAATKETFKN